MSKEIEKISNQLFELKECVLEIIDYLGSRNGFDNWWLQVEVNEEIEITKKLEDIIERRLNQNKDEVGKSGKVQ